MNRHISSLARAVVIIHQALVQRHEPQRWPELPGSCWHRALKLLERSQRARCRNWILAADRLAREFHGALGTLVSQLTELQQAEEQPATSLRSSSYRDVYRDLTELTREFATVKYESSHHQLRISTEPIELNGIYLGPFEIRLDLGRLDDTPAYRVVALEPNPAASCEEVTHPHVLNELLCEGEGRLAINRALAEGRLLDFFQLIAGVLRTYNDESPYMELSNWDSQPCHGCGVLVHPEQGDGCSDCESWLCYECEATCSSCGEGHCHQCLRSCGRCEEPFCAKCLKTCSGCLEQVCNSCLIPDARVW